MEFLSFVWKFAWLVYVKFSKPPQQQYGHIVENISSGLCFFSVTCNPQCLSLWEGTEKGLYCVVPECKLSSSLCLIWVTAAVSGEIYNTASMQWFFPWLYLPSLQQSETEKLFEPEICSSFPFSEITGSCERLVISQAQTTIFKCLSIDVEAHQPLGTIEVDLGAFLGIGSGPISGNQLGKKKKKKRIKWLVQDGWTNGTNGWQGSGALDAIPALRLLN